MERSNTLIIFQPADVRLWSTQSTCLNEALSVILSRGAMFSGF